MRHSRGDEIRAILLNTLLAFLLLEAIFSLLFYLKDTTFSPDPRQYADAYTDRERARRYFREHHASARMTWHPYVYWRRKPFAGSLIHVDSQGIRRSIYPHPLHADTTYRVFFYGGSTLWGTGAPDDQTIPSQVGAFLAREGIDTEVVNRGESGYVHTQEIIDLLRQLQQGHIPDIVVFFDGANDVFTAYQQGIAGWPQNEHHRMQEFNLSQPERRWELPFLFLRNSALARLVRGLLRSTGLLPRIPHVPVQLDSLASAVVDSYAANLRMVKALAEAYGFEVLFYWQPVTFTKFPLTPYEARAAATMAYLKPFYLKVNRQITRRHIALGDHFHDLSNLFSNEPASLFIDWCHLSPEANRRIAQRMVKDLLPLFRKEVKSQSPDSLSDR